MSRVGSPTTREIGRVILGLAVLAGGFYLATYLFFWTLFGGGGPPPLPEWWTPLLLLIPFFWFSPLIIVPIVTITLIFHVTRNVIWKEFFPGSATPPTPRLSRSNWRKWLRTRATFLPIFLLTLTIIFFPLTYALDYQSVHSITVVMNVNGRQSSDYPAQVNFSVFLYIGNPNSIVQSVRVTGTRLSLVVDSVPAGTQLILTDLMVGGPDYRDVAYDFKFSLSASDAAAVLRHHPNNVTLTVEFLASTVFNQQQITKIVTTTY